MVKVSGKTVEEALNQALVDLNTTRDDVEYKVIEEPQKGFLGLIGTRPALLEVTVKPKPQEEAIAFLKAVISQMNVDVEVELQEDKGRQFTLNLKGDDLGILIGKRGKTLDSLQYLVNLATNKTSDRYVRIILDAENYRERRKQSLEQLAQHLAEKAKRTNQDVHLEPMNGRERKIIHSVVQTIKGVSTYSDGKEPRRRVVITPKI